MLILETGLVSLLGYSLLMMACPFSSHEWISKSFFHVPQTPSLDVCLFTIINFIFMIFMRTQDQPRFCCSSSKHCSPGNVIPVPGIGICLRLPILGTTHTILQPCLSYCWNCPHILTIGYLCHISLFKTHLNFCYHKHMLWGHISLCLHICCLALGSKTLEIFCSRFK